MMHLCITQCTYWTPLRTTMVLCPTVDSLAFTPPDDEMSEMVYRCVSHSQLWMNNLSKVATQWLEVDSNLRPSGYKAQNTTASHLGQKRYTKLLLAQLKKWFNLVVLGLRVPIN